MKTKHYCINTVLSYMADLRQFVSFIGKDLEMIDSSDIEGFINYILSQKNRYSGKPLKPQTVNRKLVALRQFIEWLNGNTDIRIFIEIKLMEIQRQEYLSENLLSIGEFERLIKAAKKEDELQNKQALALFYGLYYTGLRISELLQIRVNDLEKLDLWVKGKGGKYREIPLANKLKPVLMEYAKLRFLSEEDYVYVNLKNKKLMSRQTAHRIIKIYGGKAKLKLKKVHVHNLRHLFCMNLLENGATLEEVADLAGHSNINTTRIYTRKTKNELRQTVEKL